MARTWLSVSVELLGGRGEDLWPWPGRIFAVGPSHTFMDLADAINDAFARWDRAHLSLFTLADGRIVTDPETGAEVVNSITGPLVTALDIDVEKVARTVPLGGEFKFTFDLGDDWSHRCVVGEQKVDPEAELGIRPNKPLPYWGWGTIPDQYGRRWANDDGESRAPRRPAEPHPMLSWGWPTQEPAPALDITEVRVAIAESDADRFLAAITGREIDDALQQIAGGIPMALEQRPGDVEPVALSIISRLTMRDADGDQVLVEDLLARLRGEPLQGRVLPADLESVSMILEGDVEMSGGGYFDLRTGEAIDEVLTDRAIAGEEAVIDIDQHPDQWLRVERAGSRAGWEDMADFAQQQRNTSLRERLERAIEGRGAFRRFRDVIGEADLEDQWYLFATDRQYGRAREFLADEGIRVG